MTDLQYIANVSGEVTAVLIPINLWNELKAKLNIQTEVNDIPQWHKKLLDERMASYEKNPENVLDFEQVIKEIEKQL